MVQIKQAVASLLWNYLENHREATEYIHVAEGGAQFALGVVSLKITPDGFTITYRKAGNKP